MTTNPNANELLQQVTEGMKVIDANGDDVGKVTFVHFADEGAVTNASDRDHRDENFLEELAQAFTGDSGPNEHVAARMLKQGYIKIDARGWIDDDKYVSSRMVEGVSGDTVRLSIAKDTL